MGMNVTMVTAFETTLRLAEKAVNDGLVPSLCLALGKNDDVLATGCYGKTSVLDSAVPVNAATLYDMASLTKLMAPTMIALRMLSRGELDLADTLPMFFGELVSEEKREVSIFHLMTHTAGFFPSVRMDKLFSESSCVLPYLLSSPLQYPVGTQVAYSCLGYIVLGKILEKVSGKPLNRLAEDEVFRPLGMKNTGYHPLSEPVSESNTAYTERSIFDDGWLVGRVHDENAFLLGGVSGNAGVFSNLNDCIRFARMLAMHGKMDGQIYLPRTILQTAMSNQTAWSSNHKGLGFDLSGAWNSICGHFFSELAAGHTGFTGTTLYIDPPTGLWVVMLSNRVHPTRDNANMPRIRHTIMTSFRSEYDVWESQCLENAY